MTLKHAIWRSKVVSIFLNEKMQFFFQKRQHLIPSILVEYEISKHEWKKTQELEAGT